jgi:hypothetical protein
MSMVDVMLVDEGKPAAGEADRHDPIKAIAGPGEGEIGMMAIERFATTDRVFDAEINKIIAPTLTAEAVAVGFGLSLDRQHRYDVNYTRARAALAALAEPERTEAPDLARTIELTVKWTAYKAACARLRRLEIDAARLYPRRGAARPVGPDHRNAGGGMTDELFPDLPVQHAPTSLETDHNELVRCDTCQVAGKLLRERRA